MKFGLSLFLSLLLLCINNGHSQDTIKIRHIGITNKPLPTVYIELKTYNSIINDSLYFQPPSLGFEKIIRLGQGSYKLVERFIHNNDSLYHSFSQAFGSFSIEVRSKKNDTVFIDERKKAIYFFEKLQCLVDALSEGDLFGEKIKLVLFRLKRGW